jgi:hypothetical protein
MAQNYRYNRFPPVANDWGIIHLIPVNDPTTPGWRGGATKLKRTNPGNNPHHHISTLAMISTGRWDFTTCVPLPPLLMTRDRDSSPWSNMPESSPQWINIARSRPDMKGRSSRNPRTSDSMYSSVEAIPLSSDIAILGIHTYGSWWLYQGISITW